VLARLSSQLTQAGAPDIAEFRQVLRKLSMKTSARNQFAGPIGAIRTGAVESEVSLKLGPALELTAIVTNESVQNLGLAEGHDVLAFVKASSIVLLVGDEGARVSARNRFCGVVQAILHGQVNTEVTLALPGGHDVLTAAVTDPSVERLGLAAGQPVTAVFKASSVFLVGRPSP